MNVIEDELEALLDQMFDAGKQHTAKYKKLEAKFIKMQRDRQLEELPDPWGYYE